MERKQRPQKPSQIRRDASGRFASPESLVVIDKFPPEQQGRWTQAGRERREAEFARRLQQLAKPLPLDRVAEIETALDVDPDAEVKAYREASYAADDRPLPCDWDSLRVVDQIAWRTYNRLGIPHKGQDLASPTLLPPAPAIATPAPISQAGDTLAVVEYREEEPERNTYTLAELVTVGIAAAIAAGVGVWSLIAKGVL